VASSTHVNPYIAAMQLQLPRYSVFSICVQCFYFFQMISAFYLRTKRS